MHRTPATYGDGEWGDLLTAYNGTAITYDEIGNRLTDGTWTYTWEHGRELASMTKSDSSSSWEFSYDANGLRTQRTDNNHYNYFYDAYEHYEYQYDSSGRLVYMDSYNDAFSFTYDPVTGFPLSLSCGDGTYYYVTNSRGDVLGITDSQGNLCLAYEYDAWGNVINYEGYSSLYYIPYNPLLYRGYVYDWETGLYYLQSRYYDPEIGRFINADAYAATGQGLTGNNMFAYCGNNPVMGYDPTGLINWKGVVAGFGFALLAVAAVAVTVATAGAASPLIAAAITTVGATVSAALIETAVTTTVGAIKEVPVVYDMSIASGGKKSGCSMVYDYGEDTTDIYLHEGVLSGADSITYGTGFVYNYDEPGDYGGTFVDMAVSADVKNVELGLDFCTSPDNLTTHPTEWTGCYAWMFTTGRSFSANGGLSASVGYDFYWQVAVF